MKRLLAGATGTLLLFAPVRFLYVSLVPVPAFRAGTFADYRYAIFAAAMIYGGAAIGLLVAWRQSAGEHHTIGNARVFRAGLAGAIATTSIVMGGWGIYRWLTLGFATESWGLAPVVAILGAGVSAVVAAGAALAWYAVHGPTEPVHA